MPGNIVYVKKVKIENLLEPNEYYKFDSRVSIIYVCMLITVLQYSREHPECKTWLYIPCMITVSQLLFFEIYKVIYSILFINCQYYSSNLEIIDKLSKSFIITVIFYIRDSSILHITISFIFINLYYNGFEYTLLCLFCLPFISHDHYKYYYAYCFLTLTFSLKIKIHINYMILSSTFIIFYFLTQLTDFLIMKI